MWTYAESAPRRDGSGGGPPWPAGPLPSAKNSEDFPCLPGYWVCYDKDMMRTTLFLLGALLAAAVHAASIKDASYTKSTAVVVRAHPWLTRGLPRESLIGIRFWGVEGAYGGGLESVTFSLRLENCTLDQLGNIQLWRMDFNNNYGFYEPAAIRLDGVHGTLSDEQTGKDTYTFTFRGDGAETVGLPDWFYPHTPGRAESDYLWLTAEIDPAISRDAKIYADVADDTLSIGGCVFTVDHSLRNDGTVAPHRVYPYKYRVNAYLTAKSLNTSGLGSVLGDRTAERLASLTDVMIATAKVNYNSGGDTFRMNLDEENYGQSLRKLTDLRDGTNESGLNGGGIKAPNVRVYLSVDKAGRLTLASDTTTNGGVKYETSVLGHAVGDKYRLAFVDHLVALAKEYKLDGVDFDWEYPNLSADGTLLSPRDKWSEYVKYGKLLRDVSEAFFNEGLEVAFCVNQTGWAMPTSGGFSAAADFVNSMAYGPWPTFLGNDVMDQGLAVCKKWQVPNRRVLVGQSIYSSAHYHFGWSEIRGKIRRDHADYFTRLDCDTIWESWQHYNDKGKLDRTGNFINFTGPSTYRAKCNRARMEGYGGVMSWGYYSDSSWGDADLLSLGRNQWQAIWPHDFWQAPEQDTDGRYLLDSEEDWFWFQENPGHDVRLTADITFTHDPLPIASFSRTLDGNGHTLTLPKEVWLCTFGNTALFQTLTGTVKDLTVVLEGRVVTRADREADRNVMGGSVMPSGQFYSATQTHAGTVTGEGLAAVLAASLNSPGRLENVTIRIAEGAEVQGAKQAGGVVANVWGNAENWFAMKGVRADIAGTVRTETSNSGETTFDVSQVCAGGLVGWAGSPAANGIILEDCAVMLRDTARIANDTGTGDAAGGVLGNSNNGNVHLRGVDVSWRDGARVVAKAPASGNTRTPSPWISCYGVTNAEPGTHTGTLRVLGQEKAAFKARWPSFWLMESLTHGVLTLPGYRLRLR